MKKPAATTTITELSAALPWADLATPIILSFLNGDDKRPLRLACRAACSAVDASVRRLHYNAHYDEEGGDPLEAMASFWDVLAAEEAEAGADPAKFMAKLFAKMGSTASEHFDASTDALAVAARRWPHISHLSFGRDEVPCSAVEPLLSGLPSLAALDLSGWPNSHALRELKARKVRLPALRHLNLIYEEDPDWVEWDSQDVKGTAALVAAFAPQLKSLHLGIYLTLGCSLGGMTHGSVGGAKLAPAEKKLVKQVFTAPMPHLERLELKIVPLMAEMLKDVPDEAYLDVLHLVARASWPRLTRLGLGLLQFASGDAVAQMLDWFGEAQIPALRHLALTGCNCRPCNECAIQALTEPRWAELETLRLRGGQFGDAAPAFVAAMSPTLRGLAGDEWPSPSDPAASCASEWPELRSLELSSAVANPASERPLTLRAVLSARGAVSLPALERIGVSGRHPAEFLAGFSACRAAAPGLRAVEVEAGTSAREAARCLEGLREGWPGVKVRVLLPAPKDAWLEA